MNPDNVSSRQDGRTDRTGERQDGRTDRQDNRQDGMKDRQNNRQEHYEDHHYNYGEYYEDRWKYAMGASLTMATFRALSCTTTTVVAGNVTYYGCGGSWYNRAYSGGTTTYIVVNAPPGH
jgi:hypothetical protein